MIPPGFELQRINVARYYETNAPSRQGARFRARNLGRVTGAAEDFAGQRSRHLAMSMTGIPLTSTYSIPCDS